MKIQHKLFGTPVYFQHLFFGTPVWLWGLAVAVPLILIGSLATQSFVALESFMKDPLALAGRSPFLGAVSNLGVVVWCMTASIAVFTGLLISRREKLPDSGALFIVCGVLTAVLMLDDLYMFHEDVAPMSLGIPEPLVLAVYAAAGLAYLIKFARRLRDLQPALLIVSAAMFATSMLADLLITDQSTQLASMSEDGTKFVGIVAWAAFHIRACWLAIGPSDGER
ncbi:MAG: hypothetical protein MI920_17115 [Kiloniellales bacterium]|nr:hypothetical protein [Kiloniellales bacterium]